MWQVLLCLYQFEVKRGMPFAVWCFAYWCSFLRPLIGEEEPEDPLVSKCWEKLGHRANLLAHGRRPCIGRAVDWTPNNGQGDSASQHPASV